MKEAEIKAAILDWLGSKRVLTFRMNTGAGVSVYKGKTRLIRYGTPGMADILAFSHFGGYEYDEARPVWIEVKNEKGQQSEYQRSFQKLVEGDGHKYILVRSVEDVERAIWR
jgi:hypothetical protein